MSIADSAISLTTSSDRTRACRRPADAESAPLFSESCVECRADCSAPMRPNTTPLTTDTPIARSNVVASRCAALKLVVRRRTHRDQRAKPGPSNEHAAGHARDGQQEAFRQQLSKDASPSRTKRGANRELATPRRRAREQKMRDVRARDEQHERNGARQQEQ